MAGTTYVLGSGLSHDGSVCLLADGRIVLAIEKERLTRVKHDGGNDRLAMEYVLDHAGIGLADVSLIVQNENFGMFHAGNTDYDGPRLLRDDSPVVSISHHLAHAYSAYGPAPFDGCAVLVVDGCGNSLEDCIDLAGDQLADVPAGLEHLFFEKDSYYRGADGELTTVVKDFSPSGTKGRLVSPPSTLHSIGGIYRTFSTYVFGGFDDSGKLMGLAPYGRPDRYDEPIFELRDGRVFVRHEALRQFNTPARTFAEMKANFSYYADIARWVQDDVERALLYLVRARYERAPARALAYAGGVALNAVANRRIVRDTPFEQLYIQPAAGDNGLAIGCAYYGWLHVLGHERIPHDGSAYLGVGYSRDRVRGALGRVASLATHVVVEGTDVIDAAAQLLADGKVVGWYQDGAEFGPRALGHRSILAHPGRPGLRDHINANIKFREDFRPFAPAVIAEAAEHYFSCGGHDSPYMLLVADAREDVREVLANVVHVDGSARLQTVTQSDNPKFHQLLRAFEALTGVPVLLNTSLNRRGMPIVETPEQALQFLIECDLDALVLDDTIVIRTAERDRAHHAPAAADHPMLSRRITGLARVHDDAGGSIDLTRPSRVRLTFADGTAPLDLAADVYEFLVRCDGKRNYAAIARELETDPGNLLEFAAVLCSHALIDHVNPALGTTATARSGVD